MSPKGFFKRSLRRLVPAAPKPTSTAVTAAMRGNRRINTKPELSVRRLLHQLGYRYRLHRRDLPGKPDIVFSRRRVAIQVQGCFWHQHSNANCPLTSKPRSNTDYWNAKLGRNIIRDRESERRLRELGWHVLVVWECETLEPGRLGVKLEKYLQKHPAVGFTRSKS